MITAWILYSLLAGALIAAGAYALAAAAKSFALPTRWIWGVAMVASVALAGAAPLRARQAVTVTLRMPTASAVAPVAAAVESPRLIDRAALAVAELSRRSVDALTSVAAAMQGRPDRGLTVGWLALSAMGLILLVAVHSRFGRLRRRWPVAEMAGSSVRVAPNVGPAVIGVARPEIVVPSWLLERTSHEQALVIAHEAEHVRARDPIVLGLAWLLVALVPWNLAAWWMLSRLRLAVELDCDARVLRRGVAPRAYGSLLIDLAGRCSGFPAGAPALADTPSHLERRLVAMRPERPRFPLLRAAGAGALALVAVLAACEAKMPTQDDVTSMDAAKAEQVATALQLQKVQTEKTQLDSVRYFVNDKPATAEEAHAIAANQIATVNIAKSQAPSGYAVISIRTLSGNDTVTLKLDPATAEKLTAEQHKMLHDKIVAAGGAAVPDKMLAPPPHQFAGLIYIDGKLSTHAEMAKLNPKDISTVEVLKGAAAKAIYNDPAAVNGVIQITTLRAAKQ